MLDISSTFDTLDHHSIVSRLHLFGVRDIALSWFTSYLYVDYSNIVHIYNYFSSPMKYGVPQGSPLSLTFLYPYLYLYPIPFIISKYPNIYGLLWIILSLMPQNYIFETFSISYLSRKLLLSLSY